MFIWYSSKEREVDNPETAKERRRYISRGMREGNDSPIESSIVCGQQEMILRWIRWTFRLPLLSTLPTDLHLISGLGVVFKRYRSSWQVCSSKGKQEVKILPSFTESRQMRESWPYGRSYRLRVPEPFVMLARILARPFETTMLDK